MKFFRLTGTRCSIALLPLMFLIFSSMKSPAVNMLNPAGEYEFTSVDDGQSFTAELKIEGEPGNYKGTVKRKDRETGFSFTDVGISGEKMIIVADVRNSVFVLRLYFTGETFNGSWSIGSDGNELKGKRIK